MVFQIGLLNHNDWMKKHVCLLCFVAHGFPRIPTLRSTVRFPYNETRKDISKLLHGIANWGVISLFPRLGYVMWVLCVRFVGTDF